MKFTWVSISGILAIGIIGGALSGLLGIGSGIIMVPILSTMWAKTTPDAQKIAQGTALAVMVPMTVAGALSYHFGGQSNLRIGGPIFLWSLLLGFIALSIPLRFPMLFHDGQSLGLVSWGYVTILAVGGVIGSTWLGAPLAAHLPADLLKKVFGVFIILVGLRMTGFYAMIGALLSHKG